jgi:hypothetical protein
MLPVGKEMFNCYQSFDLVVFVAFCRGCYDTKPLLCSVALMK